MKMLMSCLFNPCSQAKDFQILAYIIGNSICFSSRSENKLFGATKQKHQCLLCGQPFWISAGMNANGFFENWVCFCCFCSETGSYHVAQALLPSASQVLGPQVCFAMPACFIFDVLYFSLTLFFCEGHDCWWHSPHLSHCVPGPSTICT